MKKPYQLNSEVCHLLCFPQLDIVQQEYIHESGLEQFEVVKVAFDASGNWLATVEERKQKAAELELNLKLWLFDEQTQRYRLLNYSIYDISTCWCFNQSVTDKIQ